MSSEILDNLIDTLDDQLKDFLDTEQERLEAERDFLLSVLSGRSDSVAVEDLSTDLTRIYMSGYLSQYIEIDESE